VQEDLSIERDLRPDEPPAALQGEPQALQSAMPPLQEENQGSADQRGSSSNVEDEMLNKIGPGAP
jgi:hypothetical protein